MADADDGPRAFKDAHGNPLADGDSVTLIKDLKIKGRQDGHQGAQHPIDWG